MDGEKHSVLTDQCPVPSLEFLLRLFKDDGHEIDAQTLRAIVGRLFRAKARPDHQKVGRFRILRHLGQGLVYEAYDPELRRHVAIKVFAQKIVDLAPRAWLLQEATAVAKLSHPNIVVVHEIGYDEGELFIAMEYINGPCLHEWQGKSWREVVAIYLAAGKGLAAAHQAGIVHGDFRPQNVIVGQDGRARVVDFRLAWAIETAELVVSQTNKASASIDLSAPALVHDIRETLRYMAPEVLRGVAPTPASDQYAFCRSLVQALDRDPIVRRKVPRRIEAILQRGMDEDPSRRWPSMQAMLTILARDPRQTYRLLFGFLAVAGAMMLAYGLPIYLRAHRLEACDGATLEHDGTWDRARHDQLQANVLGHREDRKKVVWELTLSIIDRFTESWDQLNSYLCRSTVQNDGVETAEIRAKQACLARRKSEFDGYLRALESHPQSLTFDTASAMTALLPPSLCDNPRFVGREHDIADGSVKAQEIAALRTELARGHALQSIGHIHEAQAIVERAYVQTATLDFAPLAAEVGLLRTRILFDNQSDISAALAAAEEAAYHAFTAGHEPLFAQLAASSMYLRDMIGHQQASDLWRQLALSHLSRLQAIGTENSFFYDALGGILIRRGNCKDGLAQLDNAVRIEAELSGHDSLRAARMTVLSGAVSRVRCGDFKRALTDALWAMQVIKSHVGSMHLDVARTHYIVADVQFKRRDFTASRESLLAAIEILKKVEGEDHAMYGMISSLLCRSEFCLRHNESANEFCTLADRLITKKFGRENLNYVEASLMRSENLRAEGQFLQAAQAAQSALDILKSAGRGGDQLGEALFFSAKALVEIKGRKNEARLQALEAERVYRQAGGDWNQYADEVKTWMEAVL